MQYPERNANGTYAAGRPVKRYRMQFANGKLRLVHRLRAERALGKPLPEGVVVHHADGTTRDQAPLVICQNEAYHQLLHARMRIKAAGGNPNTDRICAYCHGVKPIDHFNPSAAQLGNFGKWHCRSCPVRNDRIRDRRAQQRLGIA